MSDPFAQAWPPRRVESLRRHVRAAIPVLKREGWEERDLRGIGDAIKAALGREDAEILDLWNAWLEAKTRMPEVVGITLADMEAAAQAGNAEWRKHGRQIRAGPS